MVTDNTNGISTDLKVSK